MGLLDGQIASVISAAFSGIFLDATLYRPAATGDDGAGGGDGNGFDNGAAVKAQVDVATDAMRQTEGYVDTDARILVLASGVDKPNTDCQITLLGVRYGIRNVSRDPCGAYWDLHGRLAG